MTSEPTTTTPTTTAVDLGRDELDRVADRAVEQAHTDGVALTGPNGLLGGLTKKVLETALAAELTDHLGYEHGDPTGTPSTSRWTSPSAPFSSTCRPTMQASRGTTSVTVTPRR